MGEEGSTTVQERSVLGAGWLGTRKQPHSSSRESQAKAAPALAPTKPKRNPKKEVSAAVRVCCSDHLSIHAIHAMPFTLFQTQTPYIQRERHTLTSMYCTPSVTEYSNLYPDRTFPSTIDLQYQKIFQDRLLYFGTYSETVEVLCLFVCNA